MQGHDSHVEVLIQFQDLGQVLVLHLGPGLAHLALVRGVEHLVDHDVVDINVELGQLLDESLSLVHRKELGNADSHERCEILG